MSPEQHLMVNIAVQNKPKMGQPCNNCGWCCLVEVCPVGQELGGGTEAPCKMLITQGDKHYCNLAADPRLREIIDVGGGCDARTAMEQLEELIG